MRDATDPVPHPLRPRDFALLLLASGGAAPRQRARDQQADRAGLELRRRLLTALVDLDPEAEGLEEALLAIVEEQAPPHGPARAVAVGLLEEWRAAAAAPAWVAHLLSEAVREPEEGRGRRGRQLPA